MLLDGEKESLKMIFHNIQPHQIADILEIISEQIKNKTSKFDEILKQAIKQVKEQDLS